MKNNETQKPDPGHIRSDGASVSKMRCRLFILAVALHGMAAGCGSDSGLKEATVNGQVTYQGQPIEEGEIRFVPIKGTKGPASLGTINQGQYTITARGGVPVGSHRVEIVAYRPIPGAKPYTEEQADGQWDIRPGDLPKEQFLPEQYNRKSTLEVTIEPDSGRVTQDFDLR